MQFQTGNQFWKMRETHSIKKFKWSSFFIELVCSAFVGVIFGLFFVATNMPIILALAGAGVAGHLGTRSLMMLKDKYGFKDYER